MSGFKPGLKKIVETKRGEALNKDQKEKAAQKRTQTFIMLIAVMTGMNYYKLDNLENQQKTFIAPFGSQTGDMWVSGESANTNYITGMLRLIISDYGSISRGTMDAKFSELMSMVYPDRSEGMRQILKKRMERFKSFNTVSEIRELMSEVPRVITENPKDVDYKTSAPKIYRVSFMSSVRQVIGDSLKPDKPEKMYVDYTIEEGRFWILDIK